MLPPSQRKQLEILGFGQFPCLLVNLLQIPRCLTQIRRLFVGPDQICHLCQQLPVFATRTLLWLLLANKNPAQKAGMRKQLLASRFINMIFENDKKKWIQVHEDHRLDETFSGNSNFGVPIISSHGDTLPKTHIARTCSKDVGAWLRN